MFVYNISFSYMNNNQFYDYYFDLLIISSIVASILFYWCPNINQNSKIWYYIFLCLITTSCLKSLFIWFHRFSIVSVWT